MLRVASKYRMIGDSLTENNLEGRGSSLTEVRGESVSTSQMEVKQL
jgi:hypothetical protein